MWVDKGREFYYKNVRKLVEQYSTENEEKSCVIERFNSTITEKVLKYFTRKYTDVLDKLIDQYNNSIHSSIKMSPVEASQKKNENKVFRNLYSDFAGKTVTPYFSVGDKVRIYEDKKCVRVGF